MLPDCVMKIIDSYVESMNAYSDRPSKRAVKRLVDRCDSYVLQKLGYILGMASSEVLRLRVRLEMRGEFVFYFHMSAQQRMHMLHIMENSIAHVPCIAAMTWIFLEKTPKLIHVPEYHEIFKNGLFCRMMEYLVTMGRGGVI